MHMPVATHTPLTTHAPVGVQAKMQTSTSLPVPDTAAFDALDNKVVFGLAMARLAERDPLATVVVSDYGRRLSLERFRELAPEGYIQCGIAEQNQLEVASALALEGYHVVVPSYACFLSTRSLDQIRVCVGSMAATVVLVGLSGGYASGVLGASHMALSDLAWLRQIPGLRILSPATNSELYHMLLTAAADPRPTYIRITHPLPSAPFSLTPRAVQLPLARAARLALVPSASTFDASSTDTPSAPNASSTNTLIANTAPADKNHPVYDLAQTLEPSASCQVALLAVGSCVGLAAQAAQLLENQGISATVYNMRTVAPLDTRALMAAAQAQLIVTIEEHYAHGGFGGVVAEALFDLAAQETHAIPQLMRLGAAFEELAANDPDKLFAQSGLTSEAIAARIMAQMRYDGQTLR